VMIVLILITETLASRASSGPVNHRWLAASLVFIAVAAAFSASDASGARCDPQDHVFQGHAIWHVLGSISLGLAHFHYRQFVAIFR